MPIPIEGDTFSGGHADDDKIISHPKNGSVTTTGAFIFRNSWGPDWGWGPDEKCKGHGFLPYRYFNNNSVSDCWTLIMSKYVDDEVLFGESKKDG